LAWTPDGKEVWFTASEVSNARSVYAMDRAGSVRLVYRAPSPLIIHDISSKRRVLFTREDTRWAIAGQSGLDVRERDYSGFEFSVGIDISPDGKSLLFEEAGGVEKEGTYEIYLRPLDGQPLVRLGGGSAQGFSPDGKWVMTCDPTIPRQLFALPVGVGERKPLTKGTLNHTAAAWFPDGRKILFEGNEPGRPLRLYVQNVDDGSPPSPLPDGTTFVNHQVAQHNISPDGELIFLRGPDGSQSVYDMRTKAFSSPKGIEPDDAFVRWSANRETIYVHKPMHMGTPFHSKIYKLNIATGKRVVLRELPVPDLAGFDLYTMLITPDGKSYFYTYHRDLSTLFLADGLK
jgi:eukaryotic-like serine/threonine-protein kinase